jgi:hypothetical protein
MPGTSVASILEWVSLLGSALIAAKLYHSGLYRQYRVFFAYILFRVPFSSFVLLADVRSPGYFYVWVLTEPLTWLFYICVVLEFCRLVLTRHKGLYTMGKWAIYIGMAISVALSVLSLLPRFKVAMPQRSRVMNYVLATDRGVTFCLAIFLLLMLFLLSRYPVPLSRNLILHAALYTVFFLSNTLNVILSSVFGVHLYTEIDTALSGVSALCVLAWLFLLNPGGEEVRLNITHFRPEQEARILYQLDNLNSTLLKVAGK